MTYYRIESRLTGSSILATLNFQPFGDETKYASAEEAVEALREIQEFNPLGRLLEFRVVAVSPAYEIESLWGDQWSPDIGGPNVFDSPEEAEEAIRALRALGEEWDREYRVTPCVRVTEVARTTEVARA